jgi:hypothetical protein
MLKNPGVIFLVFIVLLSFSSVVFAELAYIDPATNQSVLDQVIQKFLGKVKSWQTVIQGCCRALVLDVGADFNGVDIWNDAVAQSRYRGFLC